MVSSCSYPDTGGKEIRIRKSEWFASSYLGSK